jgi:hypothetical protein
MAKNPVSFDDDHVCDGRLGGSMKKRKNHPIKVGHAHHHDPMAVHSSISSIMVIDQLQWTQTCHNVMVMNRLTQGRKSRLCCVIRRRLLAEHFCHHVEFYSASMLIGVL